MTTQTLVYDDNCGVCTRSAVFIAQRATIDLVGFSELTPELRSRLPADFKRCAHLVTDEDVYSCGEAMERAYEQTGLPPAGLLPLFRRIPKYGPVRERIYRIVANNRPLVGRLLP